MNKIGILKNPIQGYAWGSKTFIPQLLGDPSPSDNPMAELWMGAHPKAPSQVFCNGEWISLPELIQKNPEDILGESFAEKFANKLPFLFKVLAAARPLSIQAHPNRDQADQGFDRENRLEIPLNAPHRNYKDKNHKPEILCALTYFWAFKGFRKIEEIILLLDKIRVPALRDELISLRKQPNSEGLKKFYTALMMSRERQRKIVNEAVTYGKEFSNDDKVFEWMIRLNQAFPGDIGVLSPILLNLVRLQPGEAIYVPAGELHGYLEGAGIELMANSDNVLRGGLTTKHVDVPELLKILRFSQSEVDILRPHEQETVESFYPLVSEEFVLSMISPRQGSPFESSKKRSVEMMICIEGDARVTDLGSGEMLSLKKGATIIVPAAVEQYRIDGEAKIYKASVPSP